MSTKVLERAPVLPKKGHEDLVNFDELAKDAKEFLGYVPLSNNAPLLQVIAKLENPPFRLESVRKYKQQKAAEAEWAARRLSIRLCFYLMCFGYVAAAILFALSMVASVAYDIHWIWACFAGITAASTITAIVGAVKREDEWRGEGIPRAHWQFFKISEYQFAIPEFVLQTAVDVKKKCPTAAVWIEELCMERNAMRLDPFLVVADNEGKTLYYLEVWNEPGFAQERQA